MPTVDRRTDRVSRNTCDEQPDGCRAIDLGLREPEVLAHAFGDQREAVVQRAPGSDLTDPKTCDEQSAPEARCQERHSPALGSALFGSLTHNTLQQRRPVRRM